MRIRVILEGEGDKVIEVLDESPGRLSIEIVEGGTYTLEIVEGGLEDPGEVLALVLERLKGRRGVAGE